MVSNIGSTVASYVMHDLRSYMIDYNAIRESKNAMLQRFNKAKKTAEENGTITYKKLN